MLPPGHAWVRERESVADMKLTATRALVVATATALAGAASAAAVQAPTVKQVGLAWPVSEIPPDQVKYASLCFDGRNIYPDRVKVWRDGKRVIFSSLTAPSEVGHFNFDTGCETRIKIKASAGEGSRTQTTVFKGRRCLPPYPTA
jgi:hypothetical protein